MKKAPLFFLMLFGCIFVDSTFAASYYVNAELGKDSNKGTTAKKPFQTIHRVNQLVLQPGDSVLFASGQQFTGMLIIQNAKGSLQKPIVISSYANEANKEKPAIDAGNNLNAIWIQNSSHIKVQGLEITGKTPYVSNDSVRQSLLRCGVLVEVTNNEAYENIQLTDLMVHDVYYHKPGFTRSAAETKSANGTQSYGWGIRFINNTKQGKLSNVKVLRTSIRNVSHTGLKATATRNGILNLEIADCKVNYTGGPGMQFSGVTKAHIHHNQIAFSGSTSDSRNWGRGSGLWTWSCADFIIEHNRFENANGPGDSAGVHIDYNCNDIIIQYNLSANNAGGFCEILGNNFNCAYRYNVSINDGYRTKGVNGAFQEGKTFWLSGYVGDQKKNAGPFNSYFYNNTIYVAKEIQPKIAASSSSEGVLIANNIFYFETDPITVAGDQKKKEIDLDGIPRVLFKNNLFLKASSWPVDFPFKDQSPVYGNPQFAKKGGFEIADYTPVNRTEIANRGIEIPFIPNDTIGLKGGLKVDKDILGKPIIGLPDMGAIELHDSNKKQPNILVILIDDAGYADFGFMGSKDLPTPNIDALAKRGVVFTDAHVSATVCSPSRAGLITGKYQQRFGYECNESEGYTGLDTAQKILPELLKQNGYTTAAFGKWHLGYQPNQHPLKRGFDYYYGFLSGGRSYFYKPDLDDKPGAKNAMYLNNQQVSFDGYLTDDLSDKAVDFIKQQKNNPFFIYWAPNAVHTPMEAAPDDVNKFQNHPRQILAAMTAALDRAIGNLIAILKQEGKLDNTLIFFLSDNGGAHNNQSSNFPLKGFKGNKYEGGHRIPFIISWPSQLKAGKFSQLSSSLDIFPTALDAAGIPIKKEIQLDGVSLLPFLQQKMNKAPHQQLVWRKDAEAAIRFNQYKLVRVKGLGDRLYNLEKDPRELKDVKEREPQIYKNLTQHFLQWEKDKRKPIWTEGATWDTITLMIHDDLMNNKEVRVRDPKELNQFRSKRNY